MNIKKISLCGAPISGKRTIIDQLVKYTNPSKFIGEFYNERRPNYYLEGVFGFTRLQFITRTGPILYPHNVIPEIVNEADLVIYVLNPSYPDDERLTSLNDYYQEYFDYYTHYAKLSDKLWSDTPWILVFNKVDLSTHVPSIALLFPTMLRDQKIHCIATEGFGIPILWTRILELLEISKSSQ